MPHAYPMPSQGSHARVLAILPWAASITFHLALGLITAFVAMVASGALRNDDIGVIIIPTSFEDPSLSDRPGSLDGGGADPIAAQDRLKDLARTDGWSQGTMQNVASLLGGAQEATGIFRGNGATIAPGLPGDSAAAYGAPGPGGGAGPRSAFYGTGGNAVKIVYLIDHTGSLIDIYGKYGELTAGTVKAAVQTSVNNLVPLQFFDVVVFTGAADGGTISLGAGKLARATPENKAQAIGALRDTVAQGGDTDEETSFIQAFRRAFSQSPDLIYFFTDGNLSEGVLQEVKQLNAQRKVHINAIMFSYTDRLQPADTERFDRLSRLARDNGGVAKLVTARAVE